MVCDDDRTAPPGPAIRAAKRAPRGKLVRLPSGDYAPFMAAHEQAVELEATFLERHLLGDARDAPITKGTNSSRTTAPEVHV